MEKIDFSHGWSFRKEGAEQRTVDLPHDAMFEEKRSPKALSGSGGAFFEGGRYLYEKELVIPGEWKEKDIFLEIEGVYPDGEVFLNNEKIGYCSYGYNNYFFALKNLKENGNRLRIVTDNTRMPNSRWYSGAGLYRPVWLYVAEKTHVALQGIRIKTLDIDPAVINVEINVVGEADRAEIRILDGDEVIARRGIGGNAAGAVLNQQMTLPNVTLWSENTPRLYTCEVILTDKNGVRDVSRTGFGIRKISWDKNGLRVNGERVLLRGGCIHHDNGILGARSYKKSEYRRLKKLKSAGFNAIRSAHNPAGSYLLEACDELGLYVMDEAWDMWYTPKNAGDYANRFHDFYRSDLKAMIDRDYNHPSVILYSIGNEVSEPAEEKGISLAKKLVELCHTFDDSRPVTAGINITILLMRLAGMNTAVAEEPDEKQQAILAQMQNMDSTRYNEMMSVMGDQMVMAAASKEADAVSGPLFETLDIAGYNYASSRYESDLAKYSDRLILGSETFSYKLYENWEMVKALPNLAGDFMWTAWDYLGEAGVGTWTYEADGCDFQKQYPWLLADTGAWDILGNETAGAGLAKAVFGFDKKPWIGVVPVNRDESRLSKGMWRGSNAIPHWSYSGCEGRKAEIEVYSSGSSVKLFCNDKEIGEKKPEGCCARFTAQYERGILRAQVFDDSGMLLSEGSLVSAKEDAEIRIIPEEKPKAGELLYVDIVMADEDGTIECNRDCEAAVSVTGARLLGFGSAKPRTGADMLSGTYPLWYGSAKAVLLVEEECVTITAKAAGRTAVWNSKNE